MKKLQKVVINSQDPTGFGDIVMDLRNPLPLDKITLLLIIDYEYLEDLNDGDVLRQQWDTLDRDLERFFKSYGGIPGRSRGKPLRFYVIGDNGYHNENWPSLLPKFTGRLDVKVDSSLRDFI